MTRSKAHRIALAIRLVGGFTLATLLLPPHSARAQDTKAPAGATKIVVFDFELEDKSAGAGIIAPDKFDIRYLTEATAEAKRLLADTQRFEVIEGKPADYGAVAKYGLRNCDGCENGLAHKLGADMAMLGVITRVNRTEFTMLVRVTDALTGKIVSNSFTDLRMGANYAWPRGVKWLFKNRVFSDKM